MRCSRCNEPIGAYEPIRLVCPDGSQRRGSKLTLAQEIRDGGVDVVHESCYAQAEEPPVR